MIQIQNITKKYDESIILENTSYTFPERGMVYVLGASGEGKTTLFNILAGFDSDYTGEILVGGVPINQMDSDTLCAYRKDNIGFVFQNYNLLTGYTVLENVMLACTISEEKNEENSKKATKLLQRLGIEEKMNQKVENLSGGQKQRVAIARALMMEPKILFADEPTGALDRTNSTEIIKLLTEIAKERLVVVITHDDKIINFDDEIIRIKGKKIVVEQIHSNTIHTKLYVGNGENAVFSPLARATKNIKVHVKRYIAIAFIFSIGVLSFLFSLSFSNVMAQSIVDFKEKNTAFNNGYIKGVDDGTIYDVLIEDERIENVYYQYPLESLSLSLNGTSVKNIEKFPTAKAKEGLSYGVMPRVGMNEIAITPSLAKKFDDDIHSLLNQTINLVFNDTEYTLEICGIYNAGYDDFLVSSDIERKLYEELTPQNNYSISYDVKEFSDVVKVSKELEKQGIDSKNVADEVFAFETTFDQLNKLFLIISMMILGVGIFVCAILLSKLQNTRYPEIGLLSALGFNKRQISSLILVENILLSIIVSIVNFILLGISIYIASLVQFPLYITSIQMMLSILITFVVIMGLSMFVSYKLIRSETAIALRK